MKTIIQITIRGLALYQIWMIFSINRKIINKNHSTNIQEPIVQIMSKVLLFHWYIKVQNTIADRIIAIIIGISLEL